MTEWNIQYVYYARAHGRGPEEMLRHDRKEFPGGAMAGFMSWLGTQRDAFLRAEGLRGDAIYDLARWDAWLERAASAPA